MGPTLKSRRFTKQNDLLTRRKITYVLNFTMEQLIYFLNCQPLLVRKDLYEAPDFKTKATRTISIQTFLLPAKSKYSVVFLAPFSSPPISRFLSAPVK